MKVIKSNLLLEAGPAGSGVPGTCPVSLEYLQDRRFHKHSGALLQYFDNPHGALSFLIPS